VVFDSSGGFRLPDGSVLSPDAAVVRLERWQALTPEHRRGFSPLCPDLVVELVSPSVAAGFSEEVEGPRGCEALRRKMAAYLANGAQLGWLLFPEQQAVEIWQPGADPAAPVVMEWIEAAEALEGGEQLPGLGLPLWSPATSFFIGSSSTTLAEALLVFEGMADLRTWLAANA
jgi:Uma2 family endonuclease